MSCGIYKITNNINNKAYIGQSINIEERWKKHKWHTKKQSHYPLYRAFSNYGLENFTFEILEQCHADQLNDREIYWIDHYNTYYNGYNLTLGGDGAPGAMVKLSKEDIAIIYDLLANSSMTQHEIAQQFQVGDDTISEINHGKTRINFDISYPIRKNKKDKRYCVQCGKELHRNTQGNYCSNCIGVTKRRVEHPSREELKQLIRTMPFTQIANKFKVSDNAIRKWCDGYQLPRRAKEIKQYSDEEWAII